MAELHQEKDARGMDGRTTGGGSMVGGVGIQSGGVQKRKRGEGCGKPTDNGDRCPLDAGILRTRRRVYAVLWGLKGPSNDAGEVAAAVQRVLASGQDGHELPEEMLDRARRQVIPGDRKCLYWALSAVGGKGRQAAADEVHNALTEGDMSRPPESGCARRVMRDAGRGTWEQYLEKVWGSRGDGWTRG